VRTNKSVQRHLTRAFKVNALAQLSATLSRATLNLSSTAVALVLYTFIAKFIIDPLKIVCGSSRKQHNGKNVKTMSITAHEAVNETNRLSIGYFKTL